MKVDSCSVPLDMHELELCRPPEWGGGYPTLSALSHTGGRGSGNGLAGYLLFIKGCAASSLAV